MYAIRSYYERQQIAFVQGVAHVWEGCRVPLNACVIRYWHEKKQQEDYIVLVTTDETLDAKWIIRHYEERPEIEQDYEQMKSGGRITSYNVCYTKLLRLQSRWTTF